MKKNTVITFCRRIEEFCGLRSLSIFLFRCAMYNHVSVVQFLVDHVSIKKIENRMRTVTFFS